ncbi:hypothetical protein H671_2g6326 [Cricetulus griseus]|uniref:Uncharacterized protein n=1 Tax=Cricetulus griseus TaxID=10029 RepID=A0A061IK24_CRIGR|nr:hypothetical protein H671_2g6326 [Cricetulus griseus]
MARSPGGRCALPLLLLLLLLAVCSQRPEVSVGSSGDGITDNCEAPYRALRTKSRSSARAASVLNHRAISPVPPKLEASIESTNELQMSGTCGF